MYPFKFITYKMIVIAVLYNLILLKYKIIIQLYIVCFYKNRLGFFLYLALLPIDLRRTNRQIREQTQDPQGKWY